MKAIHAVLMLVVVLTLPRAARSATTRSNPTPGDRSVADYFRAETAKLADRCLADVRSLDDWKARREQYRRELFDMLSLSPLPPRGDLKPVITGKVEQDTFVVENLHFQSSPGLYVTANLYLPKNLRQPAPTILYVCGHGPVITNGVSYGNKVAYQHHGIWFARNGYVCLVLDTLQLGEIQGLHHGTYREGMWWWNSRGYTSAGVEAWNSLRALDYLETRSEVDTNRFGVTGRSGGGAYSWWLAALDDRVQAAAPVAGITDLQNHVVDGVVEGHCDCMFVVNTHRWDYPQVAALVAPRPLLIVNTDADGIFPLDGVYRTFNQVRRIYELNGAKDKLGLVIGPGPHKDTQNLQLPVFRWFNQHLKGGDPIIETAAVKLFAPEQLKVFDQLPADQRNTTAHEWFVPRAQSAAVPGNSAAWADQRNAWLNALKEESFAGWPEDPKPPELEEKFSVERHGLRFQAWDFASQPHVRLRIYALQDAKLRQPDRVLLNVIGPASHPHYESWLATLRAGFADELAEESASLPSSEPNARGFADWREQHRTNGLVFVVIAPRGIGLTSWNPDPKKQVQIRRRFMLLGQTLDGMRVWDIRRAVQALRSVKDLRRAPLWLQAEGELAADTLYASLFEPPVAGLFLRALPASHDNGPDYLNVLRVLDIPQAVAMAAERSEVRLDQSEPAAFAYALGVAKNLGWPQDRLVVQIPGLREPAGR